MIMLASKKKLPPLTEQQGRILAYIIKQYRATGKAPCGQELTRVFGLPEYNGTEQIMELMSIGYCADSNSHRAYYMPIFDGKGRPVERVKYIHKWAGNQYS